MGPEPQRTKVRLKLSGRGGLFFGAGIEGFSVFR